MEEKGGLRECEQKKRARSVVTPDDNLSAYSDSLRVSGNSSSPLHVHVCMRMRTRVPPRLAVHQSRIIIVPSVPSGIFPLRAFLFLFLSLLLWRKRRAQVRRGSFKAFRIHDSQKLNWNCSNGSPVSSFESCTYYYLYYSTRSTVSSSFALFSLLISSLRVHLPRSIDRSIDRWDAMRRICEVIK